MTSGIRLRPSAHTRALQHPHPTLSRPSFDVNPCYPDIVELAGVLIGSLRSHASSSMRGISAPQLSANVRLLCIDVTSLIVLANPEILSMSGSVLMAEPCASVPQGAPQIHRASSVVVAGVIPGSGRKTVIQASGLEARWLLHELDHLDGILTLDRLAVPTPSEPPRR